MEVAGSVAGERVLLFDDTFTRGVAIFRARQLLITAGATVVGPLVIGRHVNPPNWPPSQKMMSQLKGRIWTEDRCCLCSGEALGLSGEPKPLF